MLVAAPNPFVIVFAFVCAITIIYSRGNPSPPLPNVHCTKSIGTITCQWARLGGILNLWGSVTLPVEHLYWLYFLFSAEGTLSIFSSLVSDFFLGERNRPA